MAGRAALAAPAHLPLPAPRDAQAFAIRANAFEVVDVERCLVRVTDLDFAAFLLVHGTHLADATELPRRGAAGHQGPREMAFLVYDPEQRVPGLAMEYVTSEAAKLQDMTRRLKKVLHTRPAGYDAWRPRAGR